MLDLAAVDAIEAGESSPYTRRAYSARFRELLDVRKRLPVHGARGDFLQMVRECGAVVLEGETGSGKTTQIPQLLVHALQPHASGRMVGCTQPRRVAAMSVSRRVAEEMDAPWGGAVGYSVRFEDRTSAATVLKYMTDGMLLREAMGDPLLSRYAAIVVDEAHERTVATDILLGLLKGVVRARRDSSSRLPPLVLVIMSATLDAARFAEYLGKGTPRLRVTGRTFPVEVFYTAAPAEDYLDAAVRTVVHIHATEPVPGDVLLFLTGEEEIEDACSRIKHGASALGRNAPPIRVLPLYSSLPPAHQARVFDDAPKGSRKVVVATNIAETSLTIDGVVYVVDPGFAKQKTYNPRVRVESLLVAPISRASADQRAGRAGRTRPGKAFRLYPERVYSSQLAAQTVPEVLRCNLGAVVLDLKKLGVDDLVHFDFVDPPAPEALMRALELLHYLGALDADGGLTDLGGRMGDLPLDPQLARSLFAAADLGVLSEVLSVVAMLSVQPVWVRPRDAQREAAAAHKAFQHPDSDHLTLLAILDAFESTQSADRSSWCHENYVSMRALTAASDVRKQLSRILSGRLGLPVAPSALRAGSAALHGAIRRAICGAFFMQAAHLQRGGTYATVKDGQAVRLHPSAGLTASPEWVVYHELTLTSQNYIRTVTAVRPEWLLEASPAYYDLKRFPPGDAKRALEIALRSSKRR